MSRISQISLDSAISIGPEMIPLTFISQNQIISNYKTTIEFDEDPRFLTLSFWSREELAWQQIIPITRTLSLVVTPEGWKGRKKTDGKKGQGT